MRPARHLPPLLRAAAVALLAVPLAAMPGGALAQRRSPTAAPAADLTSSLLRELDTAARCRDRRSPHRVWCIPARGYAGGSAAPIAEGDQVLIGLTLELEVGQPVARALTERVSLASLALRSAGGRVTGKIQAIRPSNPGEERELGAAVASVAATLKGMAPRAAVSPGLMGYLATLPARATYPLTQGAQGWTLAGASDAELRRVGEHLVAIETPRSGRGIFVSVFTDRFGAAP